MWFKINVEMNFHWFLFSAEFINMYIEQVNGKVIELNWIHDDGNDHCYCDVITIIVNIFVVIVIVTIIIIIITFIIMILL